MTRGVAVDTHVLIWYLLDDPRLSTRANTALDTAARTGAGIWFPTICLVEATYLCEKGKIPAYVLPLLERTAAMEDFGLRAAQLTMDAATCTRQIPREAVPGMPDRIIAATALSLGLPLVTRDGKIRAATIETIW